MLTVNEAKTLGDGVIEPRHEVHLTCANCGYDLDATEIEKDTCADCGSSLSLAQHLRIYATSVPAEGSASL
jgi:ribosomal protein S27AE